MKSVPILTPVIAALTIAASVDVQAATIRTDLDSDTRARLELVERMRASRGLRYFNRTSPMPDAVVVEAPTVTLTSNAFAKAPAPASAAAAVNCIPASIVAPAALPPVQQSTSYQQSMVAGSVGTAPARSLMSRLSGSAASGARGQIIQSLFDARSMRIYGVGAGKAPVITVTPVVTMSQAAPAPASAGASVCVPAEQTAAKPSSQDDEDGDSSDGPGSNDGSAANNGGSTPGSSSPFLDDDLIPSFGPGPFGGQPVEDDEKRAAGDDDSGVDDEPGNGLNDGDSGPSAAAQLLNDTPNLVPEPGSLALLGLGLIGLGAARRRRPA